jgi:uncharacterized protein YabN with tetrapyrrole methylase and pyrophosphatase domain
MSEAPMNRGSLTVVGTGIRLAQQCTPDARRHIERADLVYVMSGDPIHLSWLQGLNDATISLETYYAPSRPRDETYRLMTEAILGGVRAGKRVCAVFYGHPGVFVTPSHAAIAQARREGFEAIMLPAVSAEDCLFADLGLDPGALGCQSYEAMDFFLNARRFDATALLILWQVALVGDTTFRVFESDPARVRLLAEALMEHYPADHPVTVYEAATLPVTRPMIQTVTLAALHTARLSQQSTLVIPPLAAPTISPERLARIEALREAG